MEITYREIGPRIVLGLQQRDYAGAIRAILHTTISYIGNTQTYSNLLLSLSSWSRCRILRPYCRSSPLWTSQTQPMSRPSRSLSCRLLATSQHQSGQIARCCLPRLSGPMARVPRRECQRISARDRTRGSQRRQSISVPTASSEGAEGSATAGRAVIRMDLRSPVRRISGFAKSGPSS